MRRWPLFSAYFVLVISIRWRRRSRHRNSMTNALYYDESMSLIFHNTKHLKVCLILIYVNTRNMNVILSSMRRNSWHWLTKGRIENNLYKLTFICHYFKLLGRKNLIENGRYGCMSTFTASVTSVAARCCRAMLRHIRCITWLCRCDNCSLQLVCRN